MGMLERKINGSVPAQITADIEAGKRKTAKKDFANVRISKDAKEKLEAIMTIRDVRYIYEIIDTMVDRYAGTLSKNQTVRYNAMINHLDD